MIVTLSPTLPQSADYIRILPEIVLSVVGLIVMVLEPLLDDGGWTGSDVVDGTVTGAGVLEHGAG